MGNKRSDVWSGEEDSLLVQTILQFIEKGKTQIEAFEEVGKKVKRTAAACGYRWNSVLRKQYTEKIMEAKEKNLTKESVPPTASAAPQDETPTNSPASKTKFVFEEVLDYLRTVYDESNPSVYHEKIIQGYKKKIESLERELAVAKEVNEQIQEENQQLQEENKRLTGIMGHVREMVVAGES